MRTEKPMTRKEYYAEIGKRDSAHVKQDSLWGAPAVSLAVFALASLLTLATMFLLVTRI